MTICKGALNIKGKHFPCDFIEKNMPESKSHMGWAHSNSEVEAIWTDGDEQSPGDNPGEMLIYGIYIRCYLTEDGDEQDGIRIWKPNSDELPAYKAVMGSLAMAPRVADAIYGIDGGD